MNGEKLKLNSAKSGLKPKKGRLFIFLIIAFFVVAVCFGLFNFINMNNTKKTNSLEGSAVQEVINSASLFASEGNYSKAISTIDEALNKTSNSEVRAELMAKKASVVSKSGEQAGALSMAIEAYDTNGTTYTASVAGSIARSSGDIETARKYYKIALDLEVAAAESGGPSDVQYLQSVLDSLEESAQ